MLDASSIGTVLDVYRPERATLVDLLAGLGPADWRRPTECPAYPVQGVASHVLGDDLSLLSRQRDSSEDGITIISRDRPGVEFRALLDAFNDQWVTATRFLSTALLIELLRQSGEWTAGYCQAVDPESPGEAVGLFGADLGTSSPFWQAIAREYYERWIHHSQIRRALGLPSLVEREFLGPGAEVVGAIAGMEAVAPDTPQGDWAIGPVALGPAQQTADILTRAHRAGRVAELVSGPPGVVEAFAAAIGRP